MRASREAPLLIEAGVFEVEAAVVGSGAHGADNVDGGVAGRRGLGAGFFHELAPQSQVLGALARLAEGRHLSVYVHLADHGLASGGEGGGLGAPIGARCARGGFC